MGLEQRGRPRVSGEIPNAARKLNLCEPQLLNLHSGACEPQLLMPVRPRACNFIYFLLCNEITLSNFQTFTKVLPHIAVMLLYGIRKERQ